MPPQQIVARRLAGVAPEDDGAAAFVKNSQKALGNVSKKDAIADQESSRFTKISSGCGTYLSSRSVTRLICGTRAPFLFVEK